MIALLYIASIVLLVLKLASVLVISWWAVVLPAGIAVGLQAALFLVAVLVVASSTRSLRQ